MTLVSLFIEPRRIQNGSPPEIERLYSIKLTISSKFLNVRDYFSYIVVIDNIANQACKIS